MVWLIEHGQTMGIVDRPACRAIRLGGNEVEDRMSSAPRSLRDYRMLLSSILVCEAAGVVGGVATASSVNTWYRALRKPSFNPPSWVFGPVWTLLYLLMGVSLYLTRKAGRAAGDNGTARKLFTIQLLFNALW